jgi:2-polyprenyl-3-methyl-5-hydroxy-6-metoxy-1,4-benzoquinol methylase
MVIERAPDWADTTVAPGPERTPAVDPALVELAADLAPGSALDLGCGTGADSIWLAKLGWDVTAVDASSEAVDLARTTADAAGLTIAFHVADLASWRPTARFDLVVLTDALPARGQGRSRTLEMAAAAVAPGGRILVTDLDVILGREGWMAEKHLVSREELERHLDGFRILRSSTRLAKRRHGYEELALPVASVVASRRTDLRSI